MHSQKVETIQYSVEKCGDQTRVLYTVEYYSPKKGKGLTAASAWKSLEAVTLPNESPPEGSTWHGPVTGSTYSG